MSTGAKNKASTNKSILQKQVERLLRQGLKHDEIAQKLKCSVIYVKKISATVEKNTLIDKAIKQLIQSPYISLDELGLTKSQKNMLYRSKEYQTKVKPFRVMYELRNNPRKKLDSVIKNLNATTINALEQMKEWNDVLTDRQEYESFRTKLKDILEEPEDEEIYIPQFGSEMNIDALKLYRDSIPDTERYKLTQSATKRLRISEKVAIMHDFRFVQVTNNIRILESMTKSKITKRLFDELKSLRPGARRLVIIYLRGLENDNIPVYKTITGGIDAGKFFDYIEEAPKQGAIEAEQYYNEEYLERENKKYIEGA